ncbi:MAG: sodium pump decarboxylase subunit gamma [Clostridia bacterium]|nr:sodium pump decarboxylase subunit gamma [Clostridia bacterium]NCC44224.1 sodium pump decarboxylase subunit gamma [Clostridia bacterium]
MKRTKKIILCLMSFVLIGLCGAKEASAAYEVITKDMVANCAEVATTSIESLASFDDATLDGMAESRDAFTRQAVAEWKEQLKDFGKFEKAGDAKTVVDDEEYTVTVTVPATFSNKSGEIILTFNYDADYDQMVPSYLTLSEAETFGGNMKGAGINTVMGVGTVFVVLIFLIFVISLFKFVNKIGAPKAAPAAAPAVKAAPAAIAPGQAAAEEDLTDDLELVAVISAAIAASENTSTDSFVVRSIKKVNRTKWQRA